MCQIRNKNKLESVKIEKIEVKMNKKRSMSFVAIEIQCLSINWFTDLVQSSIDDRNNEVG